MAGLLDWYGGDTENKDELGMTQADRRAPIFDSLIKAGLLAYAGAGRGVDPGQRAQMYAQAGGALADSSTNLAGQRAAAAQTVLRQQQIAAGKQKVAQQAKLADYAKSPEFQDAMKKLDPSRQMLVKAALDSGDMDAAARIMANADTSGAAADRLEIARQRLELDREKQAHKEQQGTPMTPAKAWNVINSAANKKPDDPVFASPEYKAARTLLESPHKATDPAGQMVEMPGFDLGYLPPATFNMTGEPPKPRTPTVVPGQAKKPLSEKAMDTISTGLQSLQKFEGLNKLITDNPDFTVGDAAHQILSRVPGDAGIDALNKLDPKGVAARAAIADIGSTIVHDRSGAAVTLSEYPRLAPFIPKITDSRDTILKKLERLQKEIDLDMQLRYKNIGEGSLVPDELEKRYGTKKPEGGEGKVRKFNPATGKLE